MTLPQVYELFAYWQDYPPVHEMVAAYFGIKPKSTTPNSQPQMSEVMGPEDIVRLLELNGGKITR